MARHQLNQRTVNGEIAYCEKPPYSENWNPEAGEVRRTLMTNWSDLPGFPAAVLGDVQRAGGRLQRSLPMPIPGRDHLFAVECNLKNGHGAFEADPGTGVIKFLDKVNDLEGFAEWEVVFRPLPFDVLSDAAVAGVGEIGRWVVREWHGGSEVYTLPGNAFVWKTVVERLGQRNNDPVPEGLPKQRPIDQLRYTWVHVPEPLPSTIFNPVNPIIGKINAKDFDGANGNPTYGPKTLLLLDVEITPRMWTPSGRAIRNITYVMGLRPDSGWNAFYRASLNSFDAILAKAQIPGQLAGSEQPYEQRELGDLFLP